MESKYKTLYEWKKADPKAFTSAKTNGLLPIICEMHGWIIKKPNNYWTLERCQEEALKYSHKKEWEKNGGGSHEAAKNNNWLDECTKHMVVRITKPMGYWNSKENCLEEALKYDNVKDWRFNSNSSYESARKNGWFEECNKHMIIRIPNLKNCWTLELCKAEALKYTTITEWVKNSNSSYLYARRKEWLEECTKHMDKPHKPKECWTLELCKAEALKYTTRTKWIKNSNISYQYARRKEWLDECIKHMVISIKKPNNYWTLERCKEEALNYKTRSEWSKNGSGSYQAAIKNGWLDECTEHMVISEKKPSGYWTLERCKAEALKYTTITEWSKNDSGSYSAAKINKWVDECTKHMVKKITKPKGYWTLERCLEEALKYTYKKEWERNNKSSYQSARKNGWMDECTEHMVISIKKPNNYWTLERCLEEALKFETRTKWAKNGSGSYQFARINNWLEECTKHMVKKKK